MAIGINLADEGGDEEHPVRVNPQALRGIFDFIYEPRETDMDAQPTEMTDELLSAIAGIIAADAEKRRNDAGMGGEWGDRGASGLERDLEMYRCGRERGVPQDWLKYAEEARLQTEREAVAEDPEFKRYQELHARFGHLIHS